MWIDLLVVGALCVGMVAFYCFAAARISVLIDGRTYPTLFDDTYISMRYARHLAQGYGLVWNVGEPPVEGFTNLLWVLWIAVLTFVRSDPSYLVVASGATLHLVSVVVFYGLLRRALGASTGSALSAAGLLAIWRPIAEQVLNGLEGSLVLFLLVVSLALVFCSSRPRVQLLGCLVAGLMPLVRPDGLFLVLIVLGGLVLQWSTHVQLPLRLSGRRLVLLVTVLLVPIALLTGFRLAYFGDLLPNTYYLKVSDRPGRVAFGIRYVVRFLRGFSGTPLLVPLLVYSVVQPRPWLKVLGPGIVLVLAYVAYQGGDAWDWWRFMIPVLPLFLLLLCDALRGIRGVATVAVWVCLYAFTVLSAFASAGKASPLLRSSSEVADNIRIGLLLRELCVPECVTADFWAGAAPYYSGLPSLDMLGKSDRHIARRPAFRAGAPPGHDKFDFDYVIGRKPDVIVSAIRSDIAGRLLAPVRRSLYPFAAYLVDHPRFASDYEPVHSVLSNRWHGIFVRKGSRAMDLAALPSVELRLLGVPLALVFGSGWYGMERGPHSWWRWAGQRAELRLFSLSDAEVTLSGQVETAFGNDVVTVSCGPETLARVEAGDGQYRPFGPCRLRLGAGQTVVRIESQKPARRPPGDDRELGFCVRNLRLSTAAGDLAPSDL